MEIISYPPSFDQIGLIGNPEQLWLLRLVSLFLLFFTFEVTTRIIFKINKARWFFRFFIYLTSAIYVLGFSYPWDSLKIILINLFFLAVMRQKKLLWWTVIAGAVALIGINYFIKVRIPVINDLSLANAQEEVNIRFYKERQMGTEAVPTVIRRIAYNKYSLLLKTAVEDIFRAGDTESLFFQEMHPIGQKSLVLFYYPAFGLFGLSLWLLVRGKIKISKEVLIFWGALGLVYFSISDTEAYRKLFIIFVFLTIITASGTEKLTATQGFLKKATIVLLILNVYGVISHGADWLKRPDYWLDNRPLFYKGIFQMKSLNNFPKVVVADIFGLGEKYCRFYRNDCDKFEFADSDLKKRRGEKNNLMVGFWGSFADLNSQSITDRKVLESFDLRDNIANGFSTKVVATERIILQKP